MKRVGAFLGFSSALTLLIITAFSIDVVIVVLAALIIFMIASLCFKRIRQALVIPVVLAGMIFACLSFIITVQTNISPVRVLYDEAAVINFELTEIPKKTQGGNYNYKVNVKGVELQNSPRNFKAVFTSKEKYNIDLYDDVTALVKFNNQYDTPKQFVKNNYSEGVYISGKIENIVYSVESKKPIQYYLILFRENIIDNLEKNFSNINAGVLIGLICGNKDYIDNSILEMFKTCGINHYLVVSGFHISIITGFLLFAFRLFKINKAFSNLLCVLVSFSYYIIAGMSVSSLRAVIMMAVFLLGDLLNRNADTLNSLGIAVFILCFNPFVVFDYGAILTVCAVIGISLIYDRIKLMPTKKNKKYYKIFNSIIFSASISAALFPALTVMYGNISLISIILNFVIGSTISILVVLTFILLFFIKITPISYLLSKMIAAILKIVLGIVGWFNDNLSFLNIDVSGNNYVIAISLTVAFIGFALLIFKHIKVSAFIMATVFIFSSCMIIDFMEEGRFVDVYLTKNRCVVIADDDRMVVINSKYSSDFYQLDAIKKQRLLICINSNEYARKRDCVSKFDIDNNLIYKVNDNIYVKIKDKRIYASVYNYDLVIEDKYIMISNNLIYFNENYYTNIRLYEESNQMISWRREFGYN